MSVTELLTARCPKRAEHHEPGKPDGYLDRQAWFREMAKTHRQTKCDGCGLFVIWKPKTACGRCGELVINIGLHERRHHRERT